ncbi:MULTISPECIES: hypothetical protein [Amycolatopsis]|uniref:Uncharacterized protein n=1 Tax=Amycolatopsis dendrobii TaxID=2760662 RepID=A0A7W3W5S6_9PSEU|nr:MULTISPECIES: hypothetical protein [Amycolatopsis]MBB1159368.1 hypothetical protein [Amycolatopsis dendrobii]UKD55978.1 hypothetical protein L3Q65_04480 [Amycolatopsis sp. FU40]
MASAGRGLRRDHGVAASLAGAVVIVAGYASGIGLKTTAAGDALLANPVSTASADQQRRDAFRQRIVDYNAQLAEVCAEFAQCPYDEGAGFAARFDPSDMSTVDCFRPSAKGQALIADVAWKAVGS